MLIRWVVKSGSRGQQVVSYGVQGAERPFLHEPSAEYKWKQRVNKLLHSSKDQGFWKTRFRASGYRHRVIGAKVRGNDTGWYASGVGRHGEADV